jgi:nicotinamidase-related amidase
LFVLGLAYDFCVRYTAVDGNKNGFKTFVIKDACRGISGETIKETEIEFSNLGITIINSLDLEKYL